VKNVPRRKTDVNEATWLSELLAHGLILRSPPGVAPLPTGVTHYTLRRDGPLIRFHLLCNAISYIIPRQRAA
jgi:hypothetical protein